ncbi:sortilin-related receptor isoform X4 [Plutella xylostella]|uniref:sortilin-related receptor isoform X4 n=1 Tax=Plutella xylostella TaxID=51655 RepID=UPI0020329849|nr:sortilin-related receptor isoform X4 [Plutella xylostella]
MWLAFRRLFGVIGFLCLFSCTTGLRQYGDHEKTLYVAKDPQDSDRLTIINRHPSNEQGSESVRAKRDAEAAPALHKNISTWTTHLNDSHQQLMVHWVGEGSKVIICLARDSSPRNKGFISSSTLFISYNYGRNFTNKTDHFKLDDTPDSDYAQLDKFFNHPKYPEFCVFVDSTNKKIYYTDDNGHTIHRSDLSFHPSELSFDEEFPDRFVVLDKVDTNRKLYLTVDGGKTFKLIQSFVKTFFWSSGPGFPKTFYLERWKPDRTSTVFSTTDPGNPVIKVLFEDAKDFQIKEDFMFVTKQSKERNTLELYISHQRGPFYKAEFQTELDLKKFHIADVTDKRIFVSVMHSESLADLYVSEISKNFTQYNFVLSLPQIVCYFPDGNWKNSWLEDVTEDPFTDLYRVEGLRGIYIASRVDSKALLPSIGPEHLISLITYDHGVTWAPITPPAVDEYGKPFNCHIENSCSLHLCQKFSQLYPVTSPPGNVVTNELRSASIMSSKSAPGVIMATGVMGKSLKGIPGVYLSRDAGLTWKRILKDYYFFNYGDHGGVLVAVKYFKNTGETRKIMYSTNEGIDWNSYQFNDDDLRIYGLMTEPGENTTTFTMFGSEHEQHQWIIITVDLQNAFERNCTDEDYKFWSPSPPNSSISCVLGKRDTFQRRLAHTNCYNGLDYDRPVKKEICECSRRDYECDFGFKSSGNECIRNKSIKFDPYAIPPECRPGHFYKRTKGYRKIDGDVCTVSTYIAYAPDMIPCPLEEPTEFIMVALRDKIARIDISDNTTIYPVVGQKNIVAIEFDIKNNCIYWADIDTDKISRQCFNDATAQEVVVDTDLASIEGMALDWISNVLFFVDGMRRKIEAVRTDLSNEGRMRATILDSKVLSKPRGIAVHPKAGYLFWTDWDRSNPSVSRSNLDGTNIKKLFGKPIVQWPNGVTIDQMAERIYWVDAMEDYIASADLNGHYFKRILWNDDKVSHPFAVAVLKDKMYWDDWKSKSIFIADKDTGANIITINDSFSGLMELKVYAHFVQHGSNACSYKNTSCDTICLGGPANSFSCLCPDGFTRTNGKCMCPNGEEPLANMTCPKKPGATCGPHEFTCKNGVCIDSSLRCDGADSCGDGSDEARCDRDRDHDRDCADTDELDCGPTNCTDTQFRCGTGACIEKKWLCDGDNDCKDGSDEQNCTIPTKRPDTVSCSVNGFACGNDTSASCIPNSWVCDGESDCPSGEDERDDRYKQSTCAPYMFRCSNGKCIFKTWLCDGENDCQDEEQSDEKNCSSIGQSKLIPRPETPVEFPTNVSCPDWMYKCDNGKCLPYWWRCDRINDCGDNSDERGCGLVYDTAPDKPADPARQPQCGKNQFTCEPGVCIPLTWVCDMTEDCNGGEDERGCSRADGNPTYQCGPDETPCGDGRGCVADKNVCDGVPQCMDHSDEAHCEGHKSTSDCQSDSFVCDDGTRCVSPVLVCNGHQDCYDGTDELNCSSSDTSSKRIYQFLSLGVDQSSINSTSFLASCWMAQQKQVTYSFLPSIARVDDGHWRNITWTNDSVYRFTGLEPYTNYNVTFYIRDSKSNKTYPSLKYVNTTTGEGVPLPPTRLTVHQLTGRRVNVLWDPAPARGVVRYYTLHSAPPLPPVETVTTETNITVAGYFVPGTNYSFWVTATNGAFTSESSAIATITFDELGDVDDIANVSMARLTDSSVYLEWHKIRGIEGFKVQLRLPMQYAKPPPVMTKEHNITLTDLPPGINILIDIMAYKGDIIGTPFTIKLKTAGVEHETLNFTAILLKEKRTSVQLSWSPPKGKRYSNKDLVYTVFYTDMMHRMVPGEIRNDTRITTRNTSVTIDGLHACESYIFTVSLEHGPAARLYEIITRDNAKAPIKNLHFKNDEKKRTLAIMWNANCDVLKEDITYRLVITELTRNKVTRTELLPTRNVSLSHVFENVPVGGRYNICVYSNVPDAAQTCALTRGPVIPPPDNVVAWLSPNGHVMLSWRHPHDTPTIAPDHKYEVLISSKEIPADTLHPSEPDIMVLTALFSPLLTHAPPASQLYVAVRCITADGYVSDLSQVHTLTMEGIEPDAEPTTMGAVWWGATSACIAAILLGAALVHLAMRHRRLARSFLRFTSATPRYDSRRGQATLGDHDDDDVPAIHGFSDDEPLVIA